MLIFLFMDLSDEERSLIDTLYRAYAAELLRFARSFLGSDFLAEEVVQDAFLALLAKPERLANRTNKQLRAYLFSKTRYYALEALQSMKKDKEKAEHLSERLRDETPEDHALLAEIGELEIGPHVDEIIGRLSETTQEILWLKFAKSLPNDEIATRLGISYAAVCTRVSRAYREFREAFRVSEE